MPIFEVNQKESGPYTLILHPEDCGISVSVSDDQTPAGRRSEVPLIAHSPSINVNIAGVPTPCALDTGAETSLIPSHFYQKL